MDIYSGSVLPPGGGGSLNKNKNGRIYREERGKEKKPGKTGKKGKKRRGKGKKRRE